MSRFARPLRRIDMSGGVDQPGGRVKRPPAAAFSQPPPAPGGRPSAPAPRAAAPARGAGRDRGAPSRARPRAPPPPASRRARGPRGAGRAAAVLAGAEELAGAAERRSASAIAKPSCVSSSAASRASLLSPPPRETSAQVPGRSPRPTRPRSWWSCARPKRSACSTTISVAFGTSTPTSITVVETRTCVSPLSKRAIAAARAAASRRPCTRSTRAWGKARAQLSADRWRRAGRASPTPRRAGYTT